MSSKRRRRIGLGALALLFAALLVGAWLAPSRRNFYGKRGNADVRLDLAYVDGSCDPKHRLDLYLPARSGRPFPMVVFVHGGIWDAQDRRLLQPVLGLYGAVGMALASRGVGTALVSYRQHPRAASFDDSLLDLARATRFVLDHAASWGGNPERVVLVGHSAGGTLVSLLALDPAWLARAGVERGQLRGFASLAGFYSFRRLLSSLHGRKAEVTRKLAGGEAGLDRLSPETWVKGKHPPMLLLVGLRDDEVLIREHRSMAQAMAATPSPATSVEIPQDGHMSLVLDLGTDDDQVLGPLVEFIDRSTSGAP